MAVLLRKDRPIMEVALTRMESRSGVRQRVCYKGKPDELKHPKHRIILTGEIGPSLSGLSIDMLPEITLTALQLVESLVHLSKLLV